MPYAHLLRSTLSFDPRHPLHPRSNQNMLPDIPLLLSPVSAIKIISVKIIIKMNNSHSYLV